MGKGSSLIEVYGTTKREERCTVIKITVPIEIVYILAIVFAFLTVIFFMGKGSSLIEVYGTTKREEKEKYKKLSRVIGICFGIIDIFLIIISLMRNKLSEWFIYIFITVLGINILVIIVLSSVDIIFKKSKNQFE